jgi:hypothetical protein
MEVAEALYHEMLSQNAIKCNARLTELDDVTADASQSTRMGSVSF